MGQFLSEAKKDKDTISGEADPDSNLRLTFSASSMQGWRRTMEDTVKVELKLPQGEALFCVFDGHGGKEVAEFCQQEVIPTF